MQASSRDGTMGGCPQGEARERRFVFRSYPSHRGFASKAGKACRVNVAGKIGGSLVNARPGPTWRVLDRNLFRAPGIGMDRRLSSLGPRASGSDLFNHSIFYDRSLSRKNKAHTQITLLHLSRRIFPLCIVCEYSMRCASGRKGTTWLDFRTGRTGRATVFPVESGTPAGRRRLYGARQLLYLSATKST